MREIEVKFKIEDSEPIKAKINKLAATYRGRCFQVDRWMDTEDDQLKKRGWGLRLREENGRATFTFKGELIEGERFREQKEIEVEVKDCKKMRKILEGLGYKERYILRKEREKWEKEDLEIVLDRVENLGTFLELEGNKKRIEEAIRNLGLKKAERITEHYGEIYEETLKK